MDTLREWVESRFSARDEAIRLLSTEYNRRLNDLNHAHEQAREKERDFISRESFDTFVQRTGEDLQGLRDFQARIIGALVICTFLVPTLSALVVYLITRSH